MKYILMHRELSVAVLYINDVSGTVYRVEDVIHPEHLPVGLNAASFKDLAKNLNQWLAGRTIPASRSGFRHALEDMQVQKKNVCFCKSFDDEMLFVKLVRPILA